ncbi:MAG: hypothetical protein ACYTBP_07240 [Planctomycetota bacterium]|jgi:hypothetical protein
MVDRKARDKTIRLIRDFASGKITNDEFEDNLPEDSKDDAVFNMWSEAIWFCYDDMSTHKLEGDYALSKEVKKLFARMILFLKSDLKYEWPQGIFGGATLLFNLSIWMIWLALFVHHPVILVLIILPYVFHFVFDETKIGKQIFSVYIKLILPVLIVWSLIIPSYWTRGFALFFLAYLWLRKLMNRSNKAKRWERIWPFYRVEDFEEARARPFYLTGNEN